MGFSERLAAARERVPIFDHLMRMIQHYGKVNGSLQAGAVTYFGFLSFFPILALAFFTVGLVAKVYGGVEDNLVAAIDSVLPGIVGNQPGELSLDQVQSFSGWAGLIGVAGVLYTGLGWMSALRNSLEEVFELPKKLQPNFVIGKLRDLVSLAAIGLVLVLSVAVAGFVTGFSDVVLGWLHLDQALQPLVEWLGRLVGLAANVVLFYAIFRLLVQPKSTNKALWKGALLGGLGFEVLKAAAFLLLASTKDSAAFQAFGIALVLVVWINYFSRIVIYAAAWAHVAPSARALRVGEVADPVQGPRTPALDSAEELPTSTTTTPTTTTATGGRPAWLAPFAAGGAAALGLVALVKRHQGDR